MVPWWNVWIGDVVYSFLSFQALIKHLEDEDVEAFTNEVQKYDQISRLDQWFTTILLRIKKQMPDDNELC